PMITGDARPQDLPATTPPAEDGPAVWLRALVAAAWRRGWCYGYARWRSWLTSRSRSPRRNGAWAKKNGTARCRFYCCHARLFLLAIGIVAGLAACAHVAARRAQLPQIARVGGGRQLGHVLLEAVLLLLEAGRIAPDFGQRIAAFGAGAEPGPGQLGQRGQDLHVGLDLCRVVWRLALDHRLHAAEVG